MRVALLIHVAAWLLASVSVANVKTMTPKGDEILEIRTALGIATIIQIPDAIQSAIIGDQSAYRIEYVDKAVTIKPLRFGAKTNLYLFTKEKRYNLRLSVVPQSSAFYIVYIKKQDVGTGLYWFSSGRLVAGKDLTLKLVRTGNTGDGFVLLDMELLAKMPLKIQTSDFWIWQGKESKVIHSLFLSQTQIKKNQKTLVGISIQRSALAGQPLTLELRRRDESLRLEIPKEVLWR